MRAQVFPAELDCENREAFNVKIQAGARIVRWARTFENCRGGFSDVSSQLIGIGMFECSVPSCMLKSICRKIRHRIQRVWYPQFELQERTENLPFMESGCEFEWAARITVGRRVKFLRGAMVLADPVGRIVLADDVTICRYAIVQSIGGCIAIGANSLVGDFCNLYGQGGLTIGSDVMIGPGCRIIPNEHTFNDLTSPASSQPCRAEGITIGNGVWIGANVVVLDAVTIGEGAIIGAGSVVTRSIPPYAVCAGVPCSVLRMRPGH